MNISNILSISGKNGLFKLISQTKNGFIVESLEDKKRFPAFQSDGISTLDNISIYTYDDAVDLKEVFQAIYKKQEQQPLNYKDFKEIQLREYFKEILPNYDEEKVFISNIKKVYQWYNLLLKYDLISLEEEKPTTEEEAENIIPTNE